MFVAKVPHVDVGKRSNIEKALGTDACGGKKNTINVDGSAPIEALVILEGGR